MNPHISEMYITINGEKYQKNAENNCYPMTKKRFVTLHSQKQLSFAMQIH